MKKLLLAVAAAMVLSAHAHAHAHAHALTWTWSYIGNGISARGNFTTNDTPDAKGFYTITAISGARDGVQITGLQPAGTAIPGNTGYPADNLVRETEPRLTSEGFGFALADGGFSNPFYADVRTPPTYLEFHSSPPDGTGPTTELPVTFIATIVKSRP